MPLEGRIRLVAASLMLLHPFLSNRSAVEAADRPNILLILVDDLKPVLGCYGDSLAITGGIDKLAARGMRFDLAYANQAVCAPSRFNLMLGSLSTSTGMYGLGVNLREQFPNAVTLPQHFKKHGGYRTISIGKVFHVGHGNLGDPQSFDRVHKDKVIEYVLSASRETEISKEEVFFELSHLSADQRREFLKGKNIGRGAAIEMAEVADDAYADGRTAQRTIEYLKKFESSGQPFVLCAGFARPHLPFSAPKKYFDMHPLEKFSLPEVRDAPEGSPPFALRSKGVEVRNYFPFNERFDDEAFQKEIIRGYYASTSYVSAQIEKVLDALDETGLSKNTYVVLWGDHGWHLGTHNRFSKHDNFEQPTRIPLIIAGPGIKPGSVTRQLASTVDIYPTLAELAGLPAPDGPQPIDGISLKPVLNDPDARIRDHITHCYPKSKFGWAIRNQRYRLVQWGDPAEPAKCVYELYDFQADPVEKVNIAQRHPDVVAALRAKFALYPQPVLSNAKSRNTKNRSADPIQHVKPSGNAPMIADRPLTITGRVESLKGDGVIVAQGGREQGYAVHILDGRLAFDIRVNGKVSRVVAKDLTPKAFDLGATLTVKRIALFVNGRKVGEAPSPGLIPVQPKDGMSIGRDELSAAGNYTAPNPLQGRVAKLKVSPGEQVKPFPKPINNDRLDE